MHKGSTVVLWLSLGGCLRDPDPGGQEGEEIWNGGSMSDEAGGIGDSGSTDPDSSEGPELAGVAHLDGRLVVERGQGAAAADRDCVLAWTMAGERSDVACEDCAVVLDVEHSIDLSTSSGRAACEDLPDQFLRTYALRGPGADGLVEVLVWSAEVGLQPYAWAVASDDTLEWMVGLYEVPSVDASGASVWRTDAERAVVTLD